MNIAMIDAVRRRGLVSCVKQALEQARHQASRIPYLRERHIWYRLDLPYAGPITSLPAGMDLLHAGRDDLDLLRPLATIGRFEAECRIAAGTDLWIVRDQGKAACSFWIFWDQSPVLAASHGWMPLPEDVVCLEDSITSPDHRGRGLAPAGWARVAMGLSRQGVSAVITKIEEQNIPSRRAVEKIGFREMAVMDMERIWMMRHVAVDPRGDYGTAQYLRDRLER
jgi:RimJ/RimL family protein N-acetyltransferase